MLILEKYGSTSECNEIKFLHQSKNEKGLLVSVQSRSRQSSSSSDTGSHFLHGVRDFLQRVFMPRGYPHSVSSDYLEYQIWDTIQALASTLCGALAAQSTLKGIGVGDESASLLAATLNWLLKDGTALIGRICFAYWKGSSLDCDCKRWRLFADVVNDAAMFVETASGFAPRALFLPLSCVAGVGRSLVSVAGSATRAALTLHQSKENNMADVSAKDGSQECLSNLIGLLLNIAFIYAVTGNAILIWASFWTLCALHLYANYRAVRAVNLEKFNQFRFHLAVQQWLRDLTAPHAHIHAIDALQLAVNSYNTHKKHADPAVRSVRAINQLESVFGGVKRRHFAGGVELGCSVVHILKAATAANQSLSLAGEELSNQVEWFTTRGYNHVTVCVPDKNNSNNKCFVLFRDGANVACGDVREEEFRALFLVELLEFCKASEYENVTFELAQITAQLWPRFKQSATTTLSLSMAGDGKSGANADQWDFSQGLFNIDEWRLQRCE